MRFRLFLVTVFFTLSACAGSAPIRIGALNSSNSPTNMDMTLLSKAMDARPDPSDKIGKHTISIFMIPGPIVIASGMHLDEAVALHTKTALEKTGYNVTMVDKIGENSTPTVIVQIDDLRNYEFTWLYPIGLLWGKMDMTIRIVDTEGNTTWKAQTRGHGGIWGSIFYMTGFGKRVKDDLTENLNQIIEICSSEEFKNALVSASNIASQY
jgi:hypothetical protein